jgi:hypothetical protein
MTAGTPRRISVCAMPPNGSTGDTVAPTQLFRNTSRKRVEMVAQQHAEPAAGERVGRAVGRVAFQQQQAVATIEITMADEVQHMRADVQQRLVQPFQGGVFECGDADQPALGQRHQRFVQPGQFFADLQRGYAAG